MSKISNAFISKKICYLVIYLLIISFALVFINNDSMLIKSIIEDNKFCSFVLIPSVLLLTACVLDSINNNIMFMQRFNNKRKLTCYLLKTIILFLILTNIITLIFIFLFIIFLKRYVIVFDYIFLLILNIFTNSILIGLFIFYFRIYFNKYFISIATILLSIFIYVFNLNLNTTINNISIYAFIIKYIIIFIELCTILYVYPKKMF